MKWHEVEHCDDCPLFVKHVCPGGPIGGPNGPIFPPCFEADDDDEIGEW